MENFETFTDAYGWFIASGGATIVLSWLLAKIDVWVEWKHKFKGTLYNFLLAATVTGVTALYEAVPAETLAAIEKYWPLVVVVVGLAGANKVWYKLTNKTAH